MNKVRLTPMAHQDMRSIKTYISKELKDPIAATRVTGRITEALQSLVSCGEAGFSIQAVTGFPTDLRLLEGGEHFITYRIEGAVVSVARILNRRQDFLRVLFGAQGDE